MCCESCSGGGVRVSVSAELFREENGYAIHAEKRNQHFFLCKRQTDRKCEKWQTQREIPKIQNIIFVSLLHRCVSSLACKEVIVKMCATIIMESKQQKKVKTYEMLWLCCVCVCYYLFSTAVKTILSSSSLFLIFYAKTCSPLLVSTSFCFSLLRALLQNETQKQAYRTERRNRTRNRKKSVAIFYSVIVISIIAMWRTFCPLGFCFV